LSTSLQKAAEYQLWAERLLTRSCTLASKFKYTEVPIDDISPELYLAPFRTWAKFWESTPVHSIEPTTAAERRHIWRAYYELISDLLQHGYNYPFSPDNQDIVKDSLRTFDQQVRNKARLQQSAEIERAESAYERLLLKEVPFPEASKVNTEVIEWAELIMTNWRILCGPAWQDDNFAQGGQERVSRNVLEVSIKDKCIFYDIQ
jgi:hypothetical protein